MGDDNLISDDLLRKLVAVGQVDLVVGVPSLNHAGTIGDVVKAVHASFGTYFPRQRTVLVNSDGGSTDDTQAIVQNCCVDDRAERGTVTAAHGLRTRHRITTPYHGIPGKGNAVRLIFSAADLLQASVVVVLDPDVSCITPEWVAALATPIRDGRFDFVAPVYERQPAEGLLVTQLLRPLLRSLYGWRVREPLAGEFGCSGRLAADCVERLTWTDAAVQNGVNLWVTGAALAGSFRTCQTPLGYRELVPEAHRATLPELFEQLVGSAFAMIDAHADYWLPRTHVEDVPTAGVPVGSAPASPAPLVDGTRLLESFASDTQNLDEILRRILTASTHAAVSAAARSDGSSARLDGALWGEIVAEFLVAYHHGVMRRDHITQALLPIYMARTGTFLLERANGAPDAVEQALEELCVHFEQVKTRIVERWTHPAMR